MSKIAQNKVHAVVSGVLKENVPLNAANEEVSELSNVHNLETLRPTSPEQERSPSVSPIPTYSASPVVAGTLSLGHTTAEALGGGAMQPHLPVGMGLGFSAEEHSPSLEEMIEYELERQKAFDQKQQQGKRKSRRNRRNRSRKTHRRSHRIHRR